MGNTCDKTVTFSDLFYLFSFVPTTHEVFAAENGRFRLLTRWHAFEGLNRADQRYTFEGSSVRINGIFASDVTSCWLVLGGWTETEM